MSDRKRDALKITNAPDDPWLWVGERDGRRVSLLASPCHYYTVMLERVEAPTGIDSADGLALLNRVLTDCAARGFRSYFVMLSATREVERRLAVVLRKRLGATTLDYPFIAAAGKLTGKMSQEEQRAFSATCAGSHR